MNATAATTNQDQTGPGKPSAAQLWGGRILTALPALALIMSGTMKLLHKPEMVTIFTGKFGYPESLLPILAALELGCVALYLFPRTAVLGAIVMTGYLGGAVATHVRVSDNWVAPVLVSVLAWGGIYLRDARLRALVPLR